MSLIARARETMRSDPARACLACLLLLDIALVFSLPIIVGQDLPQHLSYARILADFASPSLAFQQNFTLPARPQPYFTAYLILAPLTRCFSVLTACRVVYAAYVVAIALSFTALVSGVHSADPLPGATPPRPRTPWTALLGPLLPWNPVQLVGFFPFMLALPGVIAGAAAVVWISRGSSPRRWGVLVLASALTVSLHLVAGSALVAFALLYALFRRSRRAFLAALVALATTALTLGIWHTLGERGLEELPIDALAANIRSLGAADGIVRTLGVQWTSAAVKGTFVVATVLGPLARSGKIIVALAIVALVSVALATRKQQVARPPTAPSPWPFALAVGACAALVVVTPAAVRVPDDICLLDFRLYVVAFLLAVACVDPRWFEPLHARIAMTAFATVVLGVWTVGLRGGAGEAMQVVRLLDSLPSSATVLALPFHDRSDYLDEDNSITHYFPVYFTALRGGVSSLFWGKYSHHLPVGYLPGREPLRPPDWDPSQFTRAELEHASNVLVEWPDAADSDFRRVGAKRLENELSDGFSRLGCDGRWCLYGHRGVIDSEEARR